MIRKVFVGGKPYLLDSDGTLLPPIMGGQWGGYRDPYYGAGTAPTTTSPDVPAGVKLPLSIQPIGGGVGILVDADGVPVVGDDGMPILRNMETGGVGAVGRTQFASEEALDRAQAERFAAQTENERQRLQAEIADTEAQLAQDRIEFEVAEQGRNTREENRLLAEMAMLEKRLDNRRRELMVTEGGAMGRTLVQTKGALQGKLLDIGPDPFKQGPAIFGGAQRGVTPQQVAVGGTQAFINAPIPQVHFGMTNQQMQEATTALQGIQPPQFGGFGLAPGAFGMAEGGVIDMEKTDGAFTMRPRPLDGSKQSFLVGEAGPETLTVEKGPFGIKSVEVTPLMGAAQGGMQLSTLQNLAPLYSGLGLNAIPTITRGPFGEMSGTGWKGVDTLSKLGIRPRLVRDASTHVVFLIEGNMHRRIDTPAWEASGFQRSDIMVLSHDGILRLAPVRGPDVTTDFPIEIPKNIGFGAQGTPFINELTGAIMPSPHKITGTLGNLQRTMGEELFQSNVMGAFSQAGMFPSQVQAQREAFTPAYREWNPQRIGWTGARY